MWSQKFEQAVSQGFKLIELTLRKYHSLPTGYVADHQHPLDRTALDILLLLLCSRNALPRLFHSAALTVHATLAWNTPMNRPSVISEV